MRWSYRDAALLWVLVASFVIHVSEEWSAGFPAWLAAVSGRPVPIEAFFIINGVALVLMCIGVRAAIRHESSGWIVVAIATIALINTLAHAAGAILTSGYAPGLISAVVLYVPLGTLTMIRAVDQAPAATVSKGIAAGTALHAAVFALAFAASRTS